MILFTLNLMYSYLLLSDLFEIQLQINNHDVLIYFMEGTFS